jgi:nuclear pore complex protein Nup133
MPLTGRIAYWDSVGSAVAEGLFTKKRGVEGKVALGSGESVTSICGAEPAGFILSTSSGRLAHLALRDAAGRPGVALTFLNGSGTSFVGSFLGALRAGTARRDVVAVKAGKILRMGEREVVVATARGNFSRWHVNRSGGYANITDIDLREDLLDALSRQDGARTGNKDHFAVLDLEVGNYRLGEDDQDSVQLLVLIAFMTPGESSSIYALVSVEVASTGLTSVDNVHVIKSYTNPLERSKTRPRLYLPSPRKTAFVVFPRAVVVISSLHADTVQAMDVDSQVFEDVVDFRGDVSVEIVGSGLESVDSEPTTANEVITSFSSDQGYLKKTRNPGVVLVAKGAGILRVEAFDVGAGTKPVATTVTVKSKLEQAVFYGSKDDVRLPALFIG